MTQSALSNHRTPTGASNSSFVRRLGLPLGVFTGTLAIVLYAADTTVCAGCTATPVLDALPWAAGAGLLVLAVQVLARLRGHTDE